MDLYLINIGLIAGVLVVLGLVTWRLWLWRERRLAQTYSEIASEGERAGRELLISLLEENQESLETIEKEQHRNTLSYLPLEARRRYTQRLNLISLFFLALNITTTVVALIPLGFAVYNLAINNQAQALTFNLAALATLVVTKGGLFLLTWVLLPAIKAIPAAIAGAVVQKKMSEWMGQKKEEKD